MCNKSVAFCQYNGYSINYLIVVKDIHDGECIQGIHFEDYDIYMTGNFGEIIYLKATGNLMDSDDDFLEE